MLSVHDDHVSFRGYFNVAFNPDTDELVKRAAKALRGVEFDTMVGTGLSGTIVAPVLARALGKRFAIVRKKGEGSHSGNRIEGNLGRRWVFVDDFISTGETLYRVKAVIDEVTAKALYAWRTDKYSAWETKFVGAYLYDSESTKDGYYSDSECQRRLADGFWRAGPLL